MNSLSFELHGVSPGIGDEQRFVKTATDAWPWLDYIHIREKHLSTEQKFNGRIAYCTQEFQLTGS